MKLIDILEAYSEYKNLTVIDTDEVVLSRYNGKDSIDEDLNERQVIKAEPISTNEVVIMIR